MLRFLRTTKYYEKYWNTRRIDWKVRYLDTFNHPHRSLIIDKIKGFRMKSILEIGCASGPNLFRIQQECPWMQFGGIDINKDAIETAKQFFPNCAVLKQSSAENIFLSDKSADIVLTDMTLIYIGPRKIDKVIKEIKRVTRNIVIFCEFHSPNFWSRMKLRLSSGYNAYDYKKLLEKHNFYDINIEKIPEKMWPGGNPQKDFGFIITARL